MRRVDTLLSSAEGTKFRKRGAEIKGSGVTASLLDREQRVDFQIGEIIDEHAGIHLRSFR